MISWLAFKADFSEPYNITVSPWSPQYFITKKVVRYREVSFT